MKQVLSLALSVLALGCLVCGANAQNSMLLPSVTQPGAVAPEVLVGGPETSWGNAPTLWATGEYLVWQIKKAPLPFPVVTTGDLTQTDFPGALGQPGTQVLFGNTRMDYGTADGLRVSLGAWLTPDQTFGLEGSGFSLDRRTATFRATSDGTGNPVLAFSVFDPEPARNAEDAVQVTFPAVGAFAPFSAAGGLAVISQSRLWGSEINGVWNLARGNTITVTGLTGFRYADLTESLNFVLDALEDDGTGDSQTVLGTDTFGTRNQFYGGQVGARVAWGYNGVSLMGTAKVALGTTHESLTIAGNTQTLNPTGAFVGAPPIVPGSVYSQPTNIGRYTRDEFTVIPELQAQLGFSLTRSLYAFVGYDFLYWSDVLRPGDQVNRVVNESQRLGLPLVGPAQPQAVLKSTNYWAQGIDFGLQFSY